jgi:hypothetical protein
LAKFAALRRASSLVRSFAAERRLRQSAKMMPFAPEAKGMGASNLQQIREGVLRGQRRVILGVGVACGGAATAR